MLRNGGEAARIKPDLCLESSQLVKPLPKLTRLDWLILWGQYGSIYRELSNAISLMMESDGISRDRLRSLQQGKLIRLLGVARQRSTLFGARLAQLPDMAKSPPLQRILGACPVLRKEDVRNGYSDMLTRVVGKTLSSRTGGTTGTPLEVVKCQRGAAWGVAALVRGRAYAGITPSSRGVLVKGFSRASFLGRTRMRLMRQHFLQAFDGLESEVGESVSELIRDRRIKFIEGYVSDLFAYAEKMAQIPEGLNAIFLTGEMAYPHQLKRIHEIFNAPVFCYYGSNEIGGIAFQCQAGEYHVAEEHVIVEVLNESGVAVLEEPGDIVVTDLDNYAMPFIRYMIGDRGILSDEPCSCGRSHLRLKAIIGREQDYLVDAMGSRIPVVFFGGRFRDFKNIGRVQIVQKAIDEILVKFDGYGHGAIEEAGMLRRAIEEKMAPPMRVHAIHSTDFKVTPRGKVPLIVSLLR